MDLNRFLTRLSMDRYRELASAFTNASARERLLKLLQADTAEHRQSDLDEQKIKSDQRTLKSRPKS